MSAFRFYGENEPLPTRSCPGCDCVTIRGHLFVNGSIWPDDHGSPPKLVSHGNEIWHRACLAAVGSCSLDGVVNLPRPEGRSF